AALYFFFSSRRRHTRWPRDWSSDVCSSDLLLDADVEVVSGHVLAVDHVDLSVEQGDIYGFLGPNGAGKTTAMRMLLGLLHPDEGEVRLFGRDPLHQLPEALDGVGGFVETPLFYPYLSGRKNLEFFAALDGGDAASRVSEVLE